VKLAIGDIKTVRSCVFHDAKYGQALHIVKLNGVKLKKPTDTDSREKNHDARVGTFYEELPELVTAH
jgi:hypothetical protein